MPTAELPKVMAIDDMPDSWPVLASKATAGMLDSRIVATRSIEAALVIIGALFWRGAAARSVYGACGEAQRPLDRQTGPELHLRHVKTARACGAGL
eukprot:3480110-Rhodomonas_salina.2